MYVVNRTSGWEGRAIDDVPRLQGSGWDTTLPTLVLIHGFSESESVGCVPAILNGMYCVTLRKYLYK